MDHFDYFVEDYFTKKMQDAIYGAGILWYGSIKEHTRDDLRKQGLNEDELDWIEDMFLPHHLKNSRYVQKQFSEETLEAIGIKQMERDKYGDDYDAYFGHEPWEEFYGPNAE